MKTFLWNKCTANIEEIKKLKREQEKKPKSLSPQKPQEPPVDKEAPPPSTNPSVHSPQGDGNRIVTKEECYLAKMIHQIQGNARALRKSITTPIVIQQLNTFEQFMALARQNLSSDPSLSGWFSNTSFHPGYLQRWLEQKTKEVKNFENLQRIFLHSGVEIRNVSMPYQKIGMTEICFFYKGITLADPFLDSLKNCLTGYQQAILPAPATSVYCREDQIQLMLEIQRLFLHYQKANGSMNVKFVAAEAAQLQQPYMIMLSQGRGEIPPQVFIPPAEPSNVRVQLSLDRQGIEVQWNKPTIGCDYIDKFLVWVKGWSDPTGQWKIGTSVASPPAIILGLFPGDRYLFAVTASSRLGVGPPSRTISCDIPIISGINETSKELSLAQKMKKWKLSGRIIQVPRKEVMKDKKRRLAKFEIGNRTLGSGPTKVLLVVGAMGAGKSTLIDGIINYVYGVKWEDDFRFKMIKDDGSGLNISQSHSQTKWITAYILHKEEGFALPYTLKIIDTPGFGDTAGIEADQELMNQIRIFFLSKGNIGIDQLDGICFVVQSALVRLTSTQQYIFDSILSVFGKDVKNSFYVLATFSDNKTPPVLQAIKTAKIPYKEYFRFNNSALFIDTEEEDGELGTTYWEMGVSSYKKFFKVLEKSTPVSLTLTGKVLKERKRLETALQGIQPQIIAGLGRLKNLRQEHAALRQHKADLEANNNFSYKVKIQKQLKVNLAVGEYVTNCLKCNSTCHYPCTVPNDERKGDCDVVDFQTGKCMVCPLNCHWKEHFNNTYRFDITEEEVTKTSDDLKEKYTRATGKRQSAQGIVKQLINEFNQERAKVLELTNKAHRCLQRLDEIALKPDQLGVTEYIDLLIEAESRNASPGFSQSIKYLQDTRGKAELAAKLKGEFDPFHEYMREFEKEGFNISIFDPDPDVNDVSEPLATSPEHGRP
ncbi:unnamed protein product [Darwinula stevensoni]|uniref:Fibronectin type-III domain-containing protein n=1 Tax=Darwinula stevensoni TaxID=69355 RepID=A0A7R8XC30_9CRUS|nr:unnamed protein product [Darwinula stevensoni]CAG0885452.1 unnamed protein product [Darwinula stevensoni]